jgi:hypothetical protein
MHQQSLDHSYSKREISLTKFKNYQSVMILVVKLGQLTDTAKSSALKTAPLTSVVLVLVVDCPQKPNIAEGNATWL